MNAFTRAIAAAFVAAAIAAPVAAASGTVDAWLLNLDARAKFAQVTDPWALNLFARQSHRDGEYTNAVSSRPVEILSSRGFVWADFGVGAASMLAVVLVAGACAVGIERTRRRASAA